MFTIKDLIYPNFMFSIYKTESTKYPLSLKKIYSYTLESIYVIYIFSPFIRYKNIFLLTSTTTIYAKSNLGNQAIQKKNYPRENV